MFVPFSVRCWCTLCAQLFSVVVVVCQVPWQKTLQGETVYLVVELKGEQSMMVCRVLAAAQSGTQDAKGLRFMSHTGQREQRLGSGCQTSNPALVVYLLQGSTS